MRMSVDFERADGSHLFSHADFKSEVHMHAVASVLLSIFDNIDALKIESDDERSLTLINITARLIYFLVHKMQWKPEDCEVNWGTDNYELLVRWAQLIVNYFE